MTPAIAIATEPDTQLQGSFLLACEAARDGECVVRLEAFSEQDGHVTVNAETWPVNSRVPLDQPVPSAYRFPTAAMARKFVDEAMIALEYLGCIVTIHNDGHA